MRNGYKIEFRDDLSVRKPNKSEKWHCLGDSLYDNFENMMMSNKAVFIKVRDDQACLNRK